MITARAVCEAIALGRVSLSTEKEAQAGIEGLLVAAFGREAVKREHRLSNADIPDFMVGGVVVEVKVRGANKMATFKQMKRYAAYPEVTDLVLATSLSMGLTEDIGGKPAYYVSLGRGWL